MASGYIDIPPQGSPFWQDAVATAADLPLTGNLPGEARVAIDTQIIWIWTGSIWTAATGGGGGGGTVVSVGVVSNTLTVTGSPVTFSGNISVESTGLNNAFAGFDSSGNLYSVPGWQADSTGQATAFLTSTNATGATSLQIGANISTPLSQGYEGIILSPNLTSTMSFMSSFNAENVFDTGFNNSGGVSIYQDQSQFNAGAISGNYDSYGSFPRLDGAITGFSAFVTGATSSGTAFNNFTTINSGHTLNSGFTNSGGTIGFAEGSQFLSGSSTSYYSALQLSPNFHAGSTAGNVTGMSLSPQFSGTVTNSFTGIDIFLPTGTNPNTGVLGLNINLSNVTTAPYLPGGISINNGSLQQNVTFDTQYIVPQAVYGLNNIGGELHVAAGFPINAGQFGILNNLGVAILAEDDISVDTSGIDLGITNVGILTQMEVATGKTMPTLNLVAAGAGIPAGSGNITNAYMYRAIGFLPEGGSLNVTNLVGYKVDPVMAAIGATNTWGFYDGSGSDNFLSRLSIGTATQKVSNSDVALEIGNNKAFMPGQVTTTQKLALVALEGMMVYDTTLHQMSYYNGTTWINF